MAWFDAAFATSKSDVDAADVAIWKIAVRRQRIGASNVCSRTTLRLNQIAVFTSALVTV